MTALAQMAQQQTVAGERPNVNARQRLPGAPRPTKGWVYRLFGRTAPTTFHKCLAVHILAAEERSVLR